MTPDTDVTKLPLRFRLGELTLFSGILDVRIIKASIANETLTRLEGMDLPTRCDGMFVQSLPIPERLPKWRWTGTKIRYVKSQYERCYIDLSMGFDEYLRKFSSKSRATLRRKVRKFADRSGGTIDWREYGTPEEIEEFYELAHAVSAKSYQERLLDAGLPQTDGFLQSLRVQAKRDEARGYLLFLADTPIAYLYCPVRDRVLLYQHLGYDPEFAKLSPGTVLQWLVLERLFDAGKYRVFDFTSGEGEHKRFFSTGQKLCADLLLLRPSFRNLALTLTHLAVDSTSDTVAAMLHRLGLKDRIKRIIRRRTIRTAS